jgi:hypothetical protein
LDKRQYDNLIEKTFGKECMKLNKFFDVILRNGKATYKKYTTYLGEDRISNILVFCAKTGTKIPYIPRDDGKFTPRLDDEDIRNLYKGRPDPRFDAVIKNVIQDIDTGYMDSIVAKSQRDKDGSLQIPLDVQKTVIRYINWLNAVSSHGDWVCVMMELMGELNEAGFKLRDLALMKGSKIPWSPEERQLHLTEEMINDRFRELENLWYTTNVSTKVSRFNLEDYGIPASKPLTEEEVKKRKEEVIGQNVRLVDDKMELLQKKI